MQARGPACDRYLEQLEQECEQLWMNGHQMCEETSLTGNHCVNEVRDEPHWKPLRQRGKRRASLETTASMKLVTDSDGDNVNLTL